MQPTGQGIQVNGATDPAGDPGSPLPPRPARAAANNAARVEGVQGIAADNAADGDTNMEANVPWL